MTLIFILNNFSNVIWMWISNLFKDDVNQQVPLQYNYEVNEQHPFKMLLTVFDDVEYKMTAISDKWTNSTISDDERSTLHHSTVSVPLFTRAVARC